jgi:hypothetical protein
MIAKTTTQERIETSRIERASYAIGMKTGRNMPAKSIARQNRTVLF